MFPALSKAKARESACGAELFDVPVNVRVSAVDVPSDFRTTR